MKMLEMMNHCGFVVDKTLSSPCLLDPYRLRLFISYDDYRTESDAWALYFYPELPTWRQRCSVNSSVSCCDYDKHKPG
jgi:hypothetical protein